MTNSKTIDVRDVADPTYPVGGNAHIGEERTNLAPPLDAEGARLPAGVTNRNLTGIPDRARKEAPDVGLPDGDIPPVPMGVSGKHAHAPRGHGANPARVEQGGPDEADSARMRAPRPSR